MIFSTIPDMIRDLYNKLFLWIPAFAGMTKEKGFTVLEVILAAALFVIFATGGATIVTQAFNTNRLGIEQSVANQYTAEGMEAVRSLRNQSWTTFAAKGDLGNQGVAASGGVWVFSGVNNTLVHNSGDNYTRTIAVTCIQRDASGNISATIACNNVARDDNTRKVVVTTTWNFNSARPDSVVLTEYFTKWRTQKGGMLVFGDGSTTSDVVKYQTFDAGTNAWGAVTPAFDVDGATANKALRAIRMYSSSTRNEKIAITRHYDGTSQYIYATVWNGTSWGTPALMASWTAATFLDVLNFDGTYLNDGTFMVVYSDNTVIPKYRIWNGTAWSPNPPTAGSSLTTLGASQIPNFIVAQARPGTNEVMAAFFTQGATTTTASTITQYYNGTTWSAITTHVATSPLNTKRLIDFTWSANDSTVGALVYQTTLSGNKPAIDIRTCVASAGACAWGTAVPSAAQTNAVGAETIVSRKGATEFLACDKDAGATPAVLCYKVVQASPPTVSASTSIAAATDTGIQRSYDVDFEGATGTNAINVYSANSIIPTYGLYTSSSSTWGSATPITTSGTVGVIKAVRNVPQDQGDDIMTVMSDANLKVFSIFWNGTSNGMYSSPAGKAWTAHVGASTGSATTDFWFDFAWDKF